jgi:hypothetical protein
MFKTGHRPKLDGDEHPPLFCARCEVVVAFNLLPWPPLRLLPGQHRTDRRHRHAQLAADGPHPQALRFERVSDFLQDRPLDSALGTEPELARTKMQSVEEFIREFLRDRVSEERREQANRAAFTYRTALARPVSLR